MFCTYVSIHESGRFYIGKGKLHLVLAGKYQGSGKKFNDFRKKYPEGWRTEVLETFEDEQEAYDNESKLVTWEMLQDKNCLNLKTGGRIATKYTEEVKTKIAAKAVGRTASPETREKMRAAHQGKKRGKYTKGDTTKYKKRVYALEGRAKLSAARAGRKRPDLAENGKRLGLSNKGYKHTPEARANMGASRLGKKRGPYKKRDRSPSV